MSGTIVKRRMQPYILVLLTDICDIRVANLLRTHVEKTFENLSGLIVHQLVDALVTIQKSRQLIQLSTQ